MCQKASNILFLQLVLISFIIEQQTQSAQILALSSTKSTRQTCLKGTQKLYRPVKLTQYCERHHYCHL